MIMKEKRFRQKLKDLVSKKKQAEQDIIDEEQWLIDQKREGEKVAKRLVPVAEKNLLPLLSSVNLNYLGNRGKITVGTWPGPYREPSASVYLVWDEESGEDYYNSKRLELEIDSEHDIFITLGQKPDRQMLANLNSEEWEESVEDALIDSLERDRLGGGVFYSGWKRLEQDVDPFE